MAEAKATAAKKKKAAPLTPPQMFHRAAQQGDLDTVQRLAPRWLAATTALGNSALHWASAAGHDEVVAFLLQAGADVAAVNDRTDTPLHSAAWRGFATTAQLLLDAGASRDAVNKDGKTPPQMVLQKFGEDAPISKVLPKFTAEELAEVGGDDPVDSDDEDDANTLTF